CQMIPSAERVRFTSSGTEATMLALRLARAYTGKPAIARFAGHFHGWHDHVAFGADPAPGILPEIRDRVVICPAHDLGPLAARDDIAAVILEPTGASFGQIPCSREFLVELRQFAARRGIVLIFDEVICGFRCSAGGAQGFYGVTPDLTTLAKIVAGGYPGAAVVGKTDILSPLEYRDGSAPAIAHQGTFNAAPVSAAAGIATLRLIRGTDAIERANRTAATIRDGMNAALRRRGVNWCVYGEFSDFHMFCNAGGATVMPADIYAGKIEAARLKGSTPLDLSQKIRAGLLCAGVDIVGWPGGVVSAVHNSEDVERTLAAFETLIERLAEEGELN
ncbi:MAG: aspartate aminotransferase family protein, partial [Dongiaceae bacterium]